MKFLSGPLDIVTNLRLFLEIGGPVLVLIMITTFIMWSFILERIAYFLFASDRDAGRLAREWEARAERTSWGAQKIRRRMISVIRQKSEQNLALIQTLVVISPLLGLLGTVTGMITVFDVMAATGASDIRSMSAGVSNATVTTMAGMVVAISGLIVVRRLEAAAKARINTFANRLEPATFSGGPRRLRAADTASVDMTPMLDIVFIMLIFFIATAVFVQEKTISLVPQPHDENTVQNNPDPLILIQVTKRDLVYVNQRLTELPRVGAAVSSLRAEHAHSGVMIAPNEQASHGTVVNIVEQVERAGGAWTIERNRAD